MHSATTLAHFGQKMLLAGQVCVFSGLYRSGYAVFPGGQELLLVKDPRLEESRRTAVTLMLNWRPARRGSAREP